MFLFVSRALFFFIEIPNQFQLEFHEIRTSARSKLGVRLVIYSLGSL